MKPILRKLLSAVLAAALLAGRLPVYASDALGWELDAENAELSGGVVLADGTFWSDSHSDLRQEYYVSYAPSERVTPVVTYGESSRALTTLSAAARELEARGLRVVAGVNGDYYDTRNGLPIGSTMTEGRLRNVSGDPYYAVGFHADGTAVIGDPRLSMQAAVNSGEGFPVFAFNYLRQSEYGIFLYDHSFNDRHTTGTSEAGVDVICSAEGGALTIGGTLALRVDEVLPDATDTAVPEGKFVFTANHRSGNNAAMLLLLRPGDRINLSVTSGAENAEAWNGVTNLLGAPVLLVENGAVAGSLAAGSAPRTAIGQRADGTLIFYTIDGRRTGYSIGATLTATAMRLVELGCVTAVALDGGGSTTIAASMPDALTARVVNSPSDGHERPVSNHVFLVAPNAPSGVLGHVYLAAAAYRALPGATVALRAAAVDTNYVPMDAAVSFRADGGSVGADRTLTLPDRVGKVTVTASCGEKSAEAVVEAVEPEQIVIRRDGAAAASLTLAPDSEAALTAEGILNHLPLAGGNGCFDWSFEGTGITFDAERQTLRAGSGAGAGTLTVSVGGKSVALPVTVSVAPLRLLLDFEGAFAPLTDVPDGSPDAQPRLTLSRSTDAAHVHNGRASGNLAYALDGENAATLPLAFAVPSGYDRLELWAYGDGEASLSVATDAGDSAAVTPEQGWQHLSIPLPSGARAINALRLYRNEAAHGIIWLDQLLLGYDRTDDAAPELSLTRDAETDTLTGHAFDTVDGAALPTLRLTYDGAALEHQYDARTGALTASLPAPDGLAHRVTLTAGDAAGNLARVTVELPADAETPPAFPDTAGHWADAFVSYLKRAGVSNGSDDGNYHPDANISRQEFAVMLWRCLDSGVDYSGVELPFADSGQIAPWALDAVKAAYALGIVTGSAENGTLRCNPTASVSRQEAAAMVGRLLDKGWRVPEPTLSDFDAVPDWAAEHVRVLNGLGVLGGYEDGAFRPDATLTRAQIAAILFRLN